MLVVLGLDHRDGNAKLVLKNVIRAPDSLFITFGLVASDNYPTAREFHLFEELRVPVPSTGLKRWRDELGAYISLGKRFLVHADCGLQGNDE
jgi:hypothetical protein